MGLQRNQGVQVKEGEQFDIRLTVEEFKGHVNMYTLWKPGMEIHVSHVKRRSIPNFVFPGGIRPSRPSKVTWVSRSSELKVSGHAQDNSPEGKAVSNGADDGRKRKQVDDSLETNLRNAKRLAAAPPATGGVHEGSPPCFTSGADDGRKRNQVDDSLETDLRNAKHLAAAPPSTGGVHEGSPPCFTKAADDGRKGKQVDDSLETNLRNAKRVAAVPPSMGGVHEGSPPLSSCSMKCDTMNTHRSEESRTENSENNTPDSLKNLKNLVEVSSQNVQANGSANCSPPSETPLAAADTREAENLAIEKIMSGPYVSHQVLPEELDELEDDFEYRNQDKDFRGNKKGSPMESSKANAAVAVPVPSTNGSASSSGLYSNGNLEELEVLFPNLVTFCFVCSCLYLVFLVDPYLCFVDLYAISSYWKWVKQMFFDCLTSDVKKVTSRK
jgi:hypothetical protein